MNRCAAAVVHLLHGMGNSQSWQSQGTTLDTTQPDLGGLGDFTVKFGSCFKISHLNPLFGNDYEATVIRKKLNTCISKFFLSALILLNNYWN
jgi:hypothetical protein